mmetsp:Transcript_2383/g.3827  ORF Transcript_2383/g.3827 Transcript_2383/m.3827 type:complete len:353 (-) Transcript_2383:279-1337(-)
MSDQIDRLSDELVRFGYTQASNFISKQEVAILLQEAKQREDYQAACIVRRSVNSEKQKNIRGDDIVWIQNEKNALGTITKKLQKLGKELGPALAGKVSNGIRAPTAVSNILKRCQTRRGNRTLLADTGASSFPPAMLARYAQGRPGFRPHVDAVVANGIGSRPDPRVLTLVLYLNDVPKQNGGILRLWRPGFEALARDHPELATIDLPPRAGTLLLFWSAVVWHQVKPMRQGDRYALSMWFHEPDPIPIVTPPGEESGPESTTSSLFGDDEHIPTTTEDDNTPPILTTSSLFSDIPPPPPADITPETQKDIKKEILQTSLSTPMVSIDAPLRIAVSSSSKTYAQQSGIFESE